MKSDLVSPGELSQITSVFKLHWINFQNSKLLSTLYEPDPYPASLTKWEPKRLSKVVRNIKNQKYQNLGFLLCCFENKPPKYLPQERMLSMQWTELWVKGGPFGLVRSSLVCFEFCASYSESRFMWSQPPNLLHTIQYFTFQ